MAEAAAPPSGGGGPLKAITRKVGPLPLWAYAAILVVGYFLYKRTKGGSTSSAPTDTTQSAANTYVPGFDAAGAGGGGGIGDTGVPGVVNNYYYGDQGSTQASGGGTSSGSPVTNPIGTPGNPSSHPPTRPVDTPGGVGFPGTIPVAFQVAAQGGRPRSSGQGY